MGGGIERRLEALEVRWRRLDADGEGVRRVAEEIAAEFGLPLEQVMAEAEDIAARGPRPVKAVAAEVAAEFGLPLEDVVVEARAIERGLREGWL